MWATRKRRGTTLVELSLVIAILAMVALPFAAFVSQNLRNNLQASTQLKEQMVLEQVMQDMEKHLRSAISMNGGASCPITFPTGGISFTSRDPQAAIGTLPAPTTYTYELRADGLSYKNGVVFPDGLEASIITGFSFPTGTGLQQLDPSTPPCYITIKLTTATTVLQKTISLRDY
ncbi:MAG: PulJ/GspJ family protein [Candidatus Cryosericum sp.]